MTASSSARHMVPNPLRFGQAVGGQHDVDVEFGLHPLDQHHRHRRRAGDREPQRAQVVAAAGGMVEQRLVDGRRSGQHGDPMLGDRAHRLLGVEGQLRDQRGAGLQAGQDPGLVAEVVEERVDAQVAVVAGDLAAGRPRRRTGQRLPVRAQHAFAAAGGAGGEQDVGDVVGPDRGGAGIGGCEIRRRDRQTRPTSRRRRRWAPARCGADRAAPTGRDRRLCRRRGTRPSPPAAGRRCGPGCRWLRPRYSGCSAGRRWRRRSAWPGRQPPSARCSATRSPPGRRRPRRG